MNPRRITLLLLSIFPLYGLWYLWDSRNASLVVVENHSGAPVTQVRISLVGVEHTKEELADGGTAQFRVHPESRSGLSLTYRDADGKERHWDEGYVGTANYRVILRINADYSISAQTTGRL